MPLEILPENARNILMENEKLSKLFDVQVALIRDPEIYIIIDKLIKVATKLNLKNALDRLDQLKNENKLRDLTAAKYMTLSQRELDKLMRSGSSTLEYALTNLSNMIDRGEIDI